MKTLLRYPFLNRTSFNGVLDDSSCLGGAAQENWSIGDRYKPDVLARLLHDYHSLLAGRTTVSCEDALDLIDRHRDWPTFVDPPYFPDQKRNKLYAAHMTRDEHERLIRILAAVRKCAVTYDYSEVVRDMFQQDSFSVNASTGCYSSGKAKRGYVIDDGTGAIQSQWKSKIELIATKGIGYQGCIITPIAAAATEPVGTAENRRSGGGESSVAREGFCIHCEPSDHHGNPKSVLQCSS